MKVGLDCGLTLDTRKLLFQIQNLGINLNQLLAIAVCGDAIRYSFEVIQRENKGFLRKLKSVSIEKTCLPEKIKLIAITKYHVKLNKKEFVETATGITKERDLLVSPLQNFSNYTKVNRSILFDVQAKTEFEFTHMKEEFEKAKIIWARPEFILYDDLLC